MAAPGECKSYWASLADAYSAMGPPLRPCAEDIRMMEEAVASWKAAHPGERLHALLLGVTPDVAEMRWPEPSSLLAVDTSMAMVQEVWPGDVPQKRYAVCGHWLTLPRRESSCQVVIGDGSLTCLRYPKGFRDLASTICSALGPGGIFVLRGHVQAAEPEDPEEVFADIFRPAIPTFHHFKFRLMMAMQPNVKQGIAVRKIYQMWASRNLDQELLVSRVGWEKRAIDTIDLYREADTIHTFPTLAELREVLSEFFEEVSISTPSYLLGDRCPILVLKPRRNSSRNGRASGAVR